MVLSSSIIILWMALALSIIFSDCASKMDKSSKTLRHECNATQEEATQRNQLSNYKCPMEGISILAFLSCHSSPTSQCYRQTTFVDVFMQPAIELAVEHINSRQVVFCQGMRTIAFRCNISVKYIESMSDSFVSVFNYININNNESELSQFSAIIGPESSEEAELIAYLSGRKSPAVMISYEATGTLYNRARYPYIHHSLPSKQAANVARIQLLKQFNWTKVAILSSVDQIYARSAEDFATLANESNISVSYLGRISLDLDAVFREWNRENIKVIVGIFGPAHARLVLCEASKNSNTLLDETHAWIFPQFSHPYWWKAEESNPNYYTIEHPQSHYSTECTDSEMAKALKSALFFGSVTYNNIPTDRENNNDSNDTFYLNETVESFIQELKNKTRASDDRYNLTRSYAYLRHSLAAASYDAVMSFALAYEEILRQGKSIDRNVSLTDELNATLSKLKIKGLANYYDYGDPGNSDNNFLVSQFIDEAVKAVQLISCNNTNVCTKKNLLDKNITLPGFGTEDYSSFTWKGSNGPPSDGLVISKSHITVTAFIVSGLLIVLASIVSATMIASLIVFRNDRHIKATSRRFMVLVIIGFTSTYFSSIADGLYLSSKHYHISSTVSNFLCILEPILTHTGFFVAFSVLVVKNWRLYKILHNSMHNKLTSISDRHLMMLFLAILIPYICTLAVFLISSTPRFTIAMITISNTEVLELSHCENEGKSSNFWFLTIALYQFLLLFMLLYFGYKNSTVAGIREHVHEGAGVARLSIAVTITTVIILCAFFVMRVDLSRYRIEYWLHVVYTTVAPVLYLLVIFVPKFFLMYQDSKKVRKQHRMIKRNEQVSLRLNQMQSQASQLKLQLHEKECQIEHLKEQLSSSSLLKATVP